MPGTMDKVSLESVVVVASAVVVFESAVVVVE